MGKEKRTFWARRGKKDDIDLSHMSSYPHHWVTMTPEKTMEFRYRERSTPCYGDFSRFSGIKLRPGETVKVTLQVERIKKGASK